VADLSGGPIQMVDPMKKAITLQYHPARRRFLQYSAIAGAALLLPQTAIAAQIADLKGEVLVNGRRATADTAIKPGDTVQTGAGGTVVFTLGADAYLLRPMGNMSFEGGVGARVASELRLLGGGLLAVFGPGAHTVKTRLVTAGIRGTGIYLEAQPERTYFCTCYGELGLSAADGSKKDVVTSNHDACYINAKAGASGAIVVAPMLNHTDQELVMLEKLVGRTPRLKAAS